MDSTRIKKNGMKLNFYILLLCLSSIGITSWGRNATPTSHLTVLQLNIWQEGSIVEGGFEAIADEVAQVDAEVRMHYPMNFRGRR